MLDLNKLIVTFILGVIEGLTEFLPISSTGHVILIKFLLDHGYDIDTVFIVIIQLGAVLSVILMFWRSICFMITICMMKLFVKRHYDYPHLCVLHILCGTLPGLLFGMYFFEKVKLIFDLEHVMYGLIIGGIFLLIAERFFFKTPYVFHINDITYFQAFLIGCFQCLSFFPGFSRSGATIGGGLLVGLDKRTSLKFSFFLSIPIVFGAVVLTVYRCSYDLFKTNVFFLLIGCVVAFCCSIFTVKFFLKIVQNVSFVPFVIYRFLLAGIIFFIVFL